MEPQHIDIGNEVKRLAPILGKQKAAKLQAAYLLGDEDYRKRIVEVIDGLHATFLSDRELNDTVLIEPPAEEIATNGDFQLGTILYGKKALYPLRMNNQDLLTHIGIFGSSGSGKTNAVYHLIQSLNSQDIPILVFDFSKRNYRELLAIPELKERIRVYTVGRNVIPFRFNPLRPPEGVQVSQWIKEFAEVFDHAYWLLGGGRHVVLKALDNLFKKYAPEYPKMADLKKWIEKVGYKEVSGREKNWISTAKRPLESLCLREVGDVFDTDMGIQPSEFFKPGQITVLEIDALSNDDKTFFIEIVLQWIRDWLLANSSREKLKGVIVLEEAHHVLNRDKTKKFGVETVTDLIFREIRELGVGMIYVDQHPSLVSYPALGNTSTHVYMNLGLDTKYSSDIQDASSMLGLSEDKDMDYLRRLPTGHSFILIRKSVFPNPFLIKFPLIGVDKGSINDERVKEEMGLQVMKALNINEKMTKDIDLTEVAKGIVQKQAIEKRLERVNSKGWKIMELISRAEAGYTSELYKKLKMSHRVFNIEVQKLIELGLVGKKEGKVYKQNAIYYFLRDEGELAVLMRMEKPEIKSDMKMQKLRENTIKALTLKGWLIMKQPDEFLLFEETSRKRVVNVEVEIDKERLFEEIDKGAAEGKLYFVCANAQIRNAVLQQAAKYSFEHKALNMEVFTATLDQLNDKGLKRVEFNAG